MNARLLDHAARAATAAVITFSDDDEVLSATALIDLLAWDNDHHDRVTESFAAAKVEMRSAQVVPIHPLPDGRTRGGFDTTYTWPYDTTLLRPAVITRDSGAELVDAAIADDRLIRLERYCRAFFGEGFESSGEQQAGWVASAAAAMLQRRVGMRTWDRFYGDLPVLFEDDPAALRGHAILLGDDHELHAPPEDSPSGDQPLVFFPPARERSDDDEAVDGDFDLTPPASLRKRLVLLNEELQWNRQDGSVRRATPARRFLQDNKLVRRFDTVDLLEHTERALASSSGTALARDALTFAFRLFASARSVRDEDLSRLNLRVPAQGKWIAAAEASFSAGWKTEMAGDLSELIERGKTVSDELGELAGRLVDAPDQRPFSVQNIDRWRTFLTAISVRDGLWPQPVAHASDSCEGRELREPQSLARRFGLSPEDSARWVAAIDADTNGTASYPYTPYRPTRPVSVLPGQRDYAALDERTRSIFARLVVAGLAQWGGTDLEVTWSRYLARHRNDRDATTWPSPIGAFLADVAWLPTTEPGERREEVFVPPAEAWFFTDTAGDRPPQFSALVGPRVRRVLSDSPAALEATKTLGLGDWLDPEHAPRLLAHLARLLDEDRLPESGQWAFRNALTDAWARATTLDSAAFAEAMTDTPLVITQSGDFDTISPTEINARHLYVVSSERSFGLRVLEAGGLPLLTVNETQLDIVASLLTQIAGDVVRTADNLDVEFIVDGDPFEPSASSARLVDGRHEWLPKLVQLVLEAKRSHFDTSSAKRRSDVIDKLSRTRVHHAAEILIKAGDLVLAPSGPHRDVVPIDDPAYPTLITQRGNGGDGLPDLVAVVPGLCELLAITPYLENGSQPRLILDGSSPLQQRERSANIHETRGRRVDPVPRLGADSLLPLSTLRPANREVVTSTAARAATCVPAWTRKVATVAPDIWRTEEPAISVLDKALQSGRLDFEALDEPAVVEMLAADGHWPAGMPHSLELSKLGLDAADMQEERDAEERERREQLEQRRRITLDRQTFSAERKGYAALGEHVRSTIREDLLTAGRRVARLSVMPEISATGRERVAGSRGRIVRSPTLSDQQTKAVGFVGETIAYEWLQRRYPAECTPASWKSSYCETIGQPIGDDTLGYDFEIALKTLTIFFEVKATSGTTTAFELGESEVGKARDCTRSERFDYRIIFIIDALDAGQRQLFLLPNPMDPANREYFRFPGSGLTCAFRLDG